MEHEWFRIEDWNEDEEDWDEAWATFDDRGEAIAAYEAHLAELQSI